MTLTARQKQHLDAARKRTRQEKAAMDDPTTEGYKAASMDQVDPTVARCINGVYYDPNRPTSWAN